MQISKINDSNSRLRLGNVFTEFISNKLQNNGWNCWLKCQDNWFKRNDRRKKICNFWTGRYYCIFKNCVNFELKISHEPKTSDFFIDASFGGKVAHDINIFKKIFYNDQRNTKALEIMAYGSMTTNDKIVIENSANHSSFTFQEYYEKQMTVLNKIKLQYKDYFKICSNPVEDALVSMNIFKKNFKEKHISGFIQSVSAVPFGITLISELQVKIINFISIELLFIKKAII